MIFVSVPAVVPAEETLDRIFTSILLVLFVASVVTPVIIPLINPVNVDVEPNPGIVTAERFAVTPNPIVAPRVPKLVVVIPMI